MQTTGQLEVQPPRGEEGIHTTEKMWRRWEIGYIQGISQVNESMKASGIQVYRNWKKGVTNTEREKMRINSMVYWNLGTGCINAQVGVYMCVCSCVHTHVYRPVYTCMRSHLCLLRGPGGSDTPVAMGRLTTQILASRYRFPLKGTKIF